MPTPPLPAISTADEVSPAAPMSWIATIASVAISSRHASISSFSTYGSPTCTVGRLLSVSASNSADAIVAPWMPSRPVLLPTYTTGLPTPAAADRKIRSSFATPTVIALTSGLPSYAGWKSISPPTVGTPTQLP